MSFLNNRGPQFLSTKLTKKGRNAIANGQFNISYFQIGDSEIDYNEINNQRIFTPLDIDDGIKYPYKLNEISDNTYGKPICDSKTLKIRNVLGPAGFVTDYVEYKGRNTCTFLVSYSETIYFKNLNGSNTIVVDDINKFKNTEYVTLLFSDLGGTDYNKPMILKNSNSLVYKIINVINNKLILDRKIPNLSNYKGVCKIIANFCENENYDGKSNITYQKQLNPWTLNVVWSQKPLGYDVSTLNETSNTFVSNIYLSTKQFLGYTKSDGQIFIYEDGTIIQNPTTYKNSFDEDILILPEEQRSIAILHYSDIGKPTSDTERYHKYDDYISYNDLTKGTIAKNQNNIDITDSEYFQIYIPFFLYHRVNLNTPGAIFNMEKNINRYVKSTKNNTKILYRNLLDEKGNSVGKIFPNNKIIVFDDQEIVSVLDYKSNRRYTLPSPKLTLLPNDNDVTNSLLTQDKTVWFSYMFVNTIDDSINGLPCNYNNKIEMDNNLNQVQLGFRFKKGSFDHMIGKIDDLTSGFLFNKFLVLAQITNKNETPKNDLWKQIDFTNEIPNNKENDFIDLKNIVDVTFLINKSKYNKSEFFNLDNYLKNINKDTITFGDEQPFPGSIKCVRGTDVEELNFQVSLISNEFNETQNPTYSGNKNKKITEISLLNDEKETLIMTKLGKPITRQGAQMFNIKLDF